MWKKVGEGNRNSVFKFISNNSAFFDVDNVGNVVNSCPRSQIDFAESHHKLPESSIVDHLTAIVGRVLRVPKRQHLELIFSPILYRHLVANYLFSDDNIEFFCPIAVPICEMPSALSELFLFQHSEINKDVSASMYLLPNSLSEDGICIELKPKCPVPIPYGDKKCCSACISQVSKNKSGQCPMYLFSLEDITDIASFLSSEKIRLKIHSPTSDVDFSLVAKVLSHSNILPFIRKSVNNLFEKFQCLTSLPSADHILLKKAYLSILYSKDPPTSESTKEYALAAYLIFKTISDCSLMINIRDKNHLPNNTHLKWMHFDENIFYSIQVIDLDEKFQISNSIYLSALDNYVNNNEEKCVSIKCWFNSLC